MTFWMGMMISVYLGKKITKKNFFRDVAIGQSFADGGNFIYTQLLSFIFVYTHLYNYSHFF